MKLLTILGASGHGKVVADIAQLNGYDDIRFLDDDPTTTTCGGYPVIGPTADAADVEGELFVAIGNAAIRRRLMERYSDRQFATLIHPNCIVASTSDIGPGTVIMAGAVVNPYTTVGCGCIVNTCASVDHDCVVGDFVHVSVGAHLCGTVAVGDEAWIGAGATVINNVSLCPRCVIGAGAVVVHSICAANTYIGVPAREMVKHSE